MTRIKYSYKFMAMVEQNGKLICNNYILTLNLRFNTDSEYDQQIAFDRMDLFMYEIISNSVFIHEQKIDLIKKYIMADIPVITMEEQGPIDHIVLVTLVTKLNAICEEAIIIDSSEITNTHEEMISYQYSVDMDSMDEENAEIYISTEESKWWNKSSPNFISNTSFPSSSKVQDLATEISWKDFNLQWEFENAENNTQAHANIVSFKPSRKPSSEN